MNHQLLPVVAGEPMPERLSYIFKQAPPVCLSLRKICVGLLAMLLSSLTVTAQEKNIYNPEKARKEMEYLENKNKPKAPADKQITKSEYIVEQHDDLIIITFSTTAKVAAKNFFQKLSKELSLRTDDQFIFVSSQNDNNGYTHYRYDQYYKGIPVAGGQFLLHEKNGKLDFANGKFYKGLSINVAPAASKEKAIKAGKEFVGAKKYLWEDESAQKSLRTETKNPNASYYPKPQLIITPRDGDYIKKDFALTYKVDIASQIPYKKVNVFVDAQTGEVVNSVSKISHADAAGASANTIYNGLQSLTTDSYNSTFRLRQSGKRPITTFNMLNGDSFSNAIDFTKKNNKWENTTLSINNIEIKNINNNWKDKEDTKPGDADIYIEIRDRIGQLVYSSKREVLFSTPKLPILLYLNITLFEERYNVRIYDYDIFSSDDFLGSFDLDGSFKALYGTTTGTAKTLNFNSSGTGGQITVVKTQSGALDVHWGLEKVYDYYLTVHGRASYDGKNSPIISYVHPNVNFIGDNGRNAYWDGSKMVFGDGDGTSWNSVTSLDICGHELTHGVIDFNGNGGLDYKNESGALNESFADIFGASIEFNTIGGSANWLMGEKVVKSGYLRSVQNPKSGGQPDTYKGKNWKFGSDDYGGVHTNSGVQNYWFYLLSQGGAGKIDGNGDDYDVQQGIGLEKAGKIAYFNMMQFLQSNATYKDAYLGSLKSATSNGYNEVSREYRAVREAWFAVGVAKKPKIASFDPTKGSEGTTVTITGENFDGISKIGFNGTFVEAPDFTVDEDGTEITVNVPTGATTGKISIVAGYQTVESDDDFTIGCDTPLTVVVTSADATSFKVAVTDGIPPYEYSLDNVTFQSSDEFTGLATGKTYTIYVKDSHECTGQNTFELRDPIQCNVQSGSGGQGTTFITQILGSTPGRVSVSYQMYTIPDQMDVYYNGSLVATTGGLVSGGRTVSFDYKPIAGGPYHCIVRITAPNSGTAWDFIAYCPVPFSSARLSSNQTEMSTSDEMKATITPNPSPDKTRLLLKGVKEKTQVVLSDITGREIWRTTIVTDGEIPLPVIYLKAGVYTVTVFSNSDQRKTLRFVKTK